MFSSNPRHLTLYNVMNYCPYCYIDLAIPKASVLSQEALKLWWGVLLKAEGKGQGVMFSILSINKILII